MRYPGRIVRRGEADGAIVRAVADALGGFGYRGEGASAGFDASLASRVKLFQSQHFDANGLPLKVDGEVGPMTWGALFGDAQTNDRTSGIAGAALLKAVGEIGVMEDPVGSNRGTRVEEYLASVGLPPGLYWCMSFVHWCFLQAANEAGIDNPFPRTGGCLDAWSRVRAASPNRILTKAQAIANPAAVKPGMVFILDHGGGLGHTGFVQAVTGGALATIEGNSNPDGSSNGIGVFALNRRKVVDRELKGFIDFTF